MAVVADAQRSSSQPNDVRREHIKEHVETSVFEDTPRPSIL
jgi:hypothetical protein